MYSYRQSTQVFVLFLVALFCVTSCTADDPSRSSTQPIQHIVFFWLNDPADPEVIADITEKSYSFEDIPGVLAVEVGKALPSDRDVVDDSFDIAVIVTLENAAALQNYLDHPIHQAAESFLKPHLVKLVVYDIAISR